MVIEDVIAAIIGALVGLLIISIDTGVRWYFARKRGAGRG